MINLRTFCPFERICAIALSYAKQNGQDSVAVDFGEFGQATFDKEFINRKSFAFDGSIFFNPDTRLDFMLAERREVVFTFTLGSEVFKATVPVLHDLYKKVSILPEWQSSKEIIKPVNNLVGETPSFYEEAMLVQSSKVDALQLVDSEDSMSEFTPYYNYVVFNKDLTSGHTEIHGPALPSVKKKVGKVFARATQRYIDIFVDGSTEIVPFKKNNEENSRIEDAPWVSISSRNLVFNGVVTPISLTQIPVICDSRKRVDLETWRDAMFLAIYADYCQANGNPQSLRKITDSNGNLNIELEDHDGILVMTREWRDHALWLNTDSHVIDHIIKRIDVKSNDKSLVVYDETGTRSFVLSRASGGTKACFAIALAYFISKSTDGSIYTAFSALLSCLDSGILKPAKDGSDTLEGSTWGSLWSGKTYVFRGPSSYYEWKSEATGVTTDLSSVPDGFYIVGLQVPGVVPDQEGIDHYVVGYISSGRIKVVHDPYEPKTGWRQGMDVTAVFKGAPTDERGIYVPNNIEIAAYNADGGFRYV